MTTRAERETLLRHCRSGLVTHALAIVWDNPAILADAGCEVLVAGSNPTILRVLELVNRRVERATAAHLIIEESRRSGWISSIARTLYLPAACVRLLSAALAANPNLGLAIACVVLPRIREATISANALTELRQVTRELRKIAIHHHEATIISELDSLNLAT